MSEPFTLPDTAKVKDGKAARWWRELEVLLLVLLVLAIYFSRLGALTIRGEESRRARVACEILETGDWVVPRQQGEIYLSRPPLGSWPIALVGLVRGKVDVVAIRLPTVTAILLTTLLIYGYARTFLSSTGAFAAAVAFATMAQVLQIGRLAETEATFTLLVASSLLLWHWGYVRSWRPLTGWACGYALAALAGLTKGPQGPIYFALPVITYLLARRDWRYLLSWAHLGGLVSFAAVLGAWQVPFYLATDGQAVRTIWTGNAAERFTDYSLAAIAKHLAGYPLEIFACTLPWSVLLVRYCDRGFRQSVGAARPSVTFLLTCVAVTFPTVWFATGAKGRYFMPLYPCLALLAGLVAERCLAPSDDAATQQMRKGWGQFLAVLAVIAVATGVAIAGAACFGHSRLRGVNQPIAFAIVYLLGTLITAGGMVYWRLRPQVWSGKLGILSLAAFLGLLYTGVVVNAEQRVSENTAAAVAKLHSQLPNRASLCSLGRIDHLFAFHFRDPIAVQPWPQSADAIRPEMQYFCFNEDPAQPKKLPFQWEKLAVISLERNHMARPRRTVVVGRCLPNPSDALSKGKSSTTKRR